MTERNDTNSLSLAGAKVNFLTVIERTNERAGSSVMWRCECICGRQDVLVRAYLLKSGRIKSCGCQTRRLIGEAIATHGLSKAPHSRQTFGIWRHMIERCEKPSHKSFNDYGGRGISVCQRWRSSFEAFFIDMGAAPDGMSIDRKDNDGDYTPENCRWATSKEQANNRRSSRLIEFRGEQKTLMKWIEEFGIPYQTAYRRLALGWSVESTFMTPIKAQKNNHICKKTAGRSLDGVEHNGYPVVA